MMNFKILYSLLLLFVFSASAKSQDLSDFKKEMKEIQVATALSDVQNDQLIEVYKKRVADLALIEDMKTSNPEGFRDKRRAIYKGSHFSINRILDKEQQEKYLLLQKELRVKRAKKIKKLQKKKASKDDILDAQFGVIQN